VKKSKVAAKLMKLVLAGSFLAAACPAMADHGPLTTNQRDPWIDSSVQTLVSAGLAPPLGKPVASMTNLEVAQLTKDAVGILMAQAQTVPGPGETAAPAASASAVKSLEELVEEFKNELSLMDVDVTKLEDRMYDQQHRDEKFEALQMEYLKQTGTNVTGSSKAYFDTYRGIGLDAIYGPMVYDDIMMEDMVMKSVPVPFVLFDADIRLTRTVGLYYADPVNPQFSLRWLSLTNTNEICNITAGDIYRHYTPLTLWNNEFPVYTLTEPTSYYRVRKDVEENVYMDHGPDWHLQGFELASDQKLDKNPVLSSFHLQAMAGELSSATPYAFANDYAGGEAALDFFDDNLEIKGTGLILQDDTGTANVPYIPNLITTFAHTYKIGSLSSTATLPFEKDFDAKGFAEWAGSSYQDNSQDSQSLIQDWALLAKGSIDLDVFHLNAKYLNIGPYFYSPGAQTNGFTPALGTNDYLTGSIIDEGLNGALDNYVFQNVGRPTFAPYDRMAENMLPYGDATPDREALILGFSAEIGKDGWLKPQGTYTVFGHELQPDYVLTPAGNSVLPVDSDSPTTNVRKFGGYEGALTLDFAKALDGTPATCDLSGDYKHQTTDLGLGGPPFTVNTLIVSADAGPFPGVPLFEGLVLSAAYEQAQASGSEFSLNGVGEPPTLASYSSYFDSGSIGNYLYQALDITRTSWALGVKCPVSKTFEIHGDVFINQYTWSDQPNFNRREYIWRMMYELTF
jgi:hypothetical protein